MGPSLEYSQLTVVNSTLFVAVTQPRRAESTAQAKRRGHNEGSIYQGKSDGRWVASVNLPSGKRKDLYGNTRKEVAEKLKQAIRDLDNGLDLDAGRLTVAQYLDKWLIASANLQ